MRCFVEECDRLAVCKGCCDMHYRRLTKNGSVYNYGSRKVDDGDEIERFHKKYIKQDNGCWIWTGGTRPNAKGVLYGRHWLDSGRPIGAHRFSYIVHHGMISTTNFMCHRCDTPLCVNPDHLFESNHNGNMLDMVQKGRSFKGRGENKIGIAKLTNKQADDIRQMTISHSKIAKMFSVSSATIGRIKRGESY